MAEEKEIKVTVEEETEAAEDEANERSPLNSKDGSIKSSQEKLSKDKPKTMPERVQQWLDMIQSNQQYRKTAILIASCLLIFVLLLLMIVIWILVVRDPLIDPNYRYLRLIPQNNEPKNTIRFSVGEYGSWHEMKNQIDYFLSEYNSTRLFFRDKIRSVRMDCNDLTITTNFNVSCYFNADEAFSLCPKRDNYGYSEGSPCVFLKFNNVKNWMPEPIRDQAQIYQMPEKLMRLYKQGFNGPFVDCEPNTAVDRENLGGNLKYAPSTQEMPARYFPYLNQLNYMSPFVAVKLERPARNIYIGITCRLWSANLDGQVEGYWYKPSAILPFHIFVE